MFSNPKRSRSKASRKDTWFDYYAGFSSGFVRSVLEELLPDRQGRVMDPWNGSGTTTTTAYEFGVCSTGVDINPVMAVVAKAKLLTPGVQESLMSLAEDVVAKSSAASAKLLLTDPLLEWFGPSGALEIRSLEQAIRKLLTPLAPSTPLSTPDALNGISDLAAFFLVALFRTTRSFIRRFQATNPTWIKSPNTVRERVRPKSATITRAFLHEVSVMIDAIAPVAGDITAAISLGSSDDLPLPSASVRAVIASPPYCTRIDYAVATKPELAVLGCADFDALRRRMLGGPVVLSTQYAPEKSWGPSCLRLLQRVQSHPSKGSATYYHKLFVQYFGSLHRSLKEIDRTLVANGHCVLVVQDSHYKELHVDVARHLSEMAATIGWSLERRLDFETRLVMARLNPNAQKYWPHTGATESVLWFRAAS